MGSGKQVGKDTSADALCRDLNFRKVAFADVLRDLAMEIDPIITSSPQSVNMGIGRGRLAWAIQGLGYENAKQTYTEVREFLQRLGLACRNQFGEDFWVEQAFKDVDPDDNVVFSDVRFENEAQAIRDAGGILIKVIRPGFNGDDHVSENALGDWDDWDLEVNNTGSITDLQSEVVGFVRKAMKS